jgi:magnesium chelatase family protein
MPTCVIRQHCGLDEAGERTLEMAVRKLSLPAPAHDRMLKVAHTIADLDGSANIASKHLPDAVQDRSLDRNYWT